MTENLRIRFALVISFLVFCAIYLAPNVFTLPKDWWFHSKKLNYGLDIQGGAHLVYGVDVKGVLRERTERMARALVAELKELNIDAKVSPSENHESLEIRSNSESDRSKIVQHLKDTHGTVLQIIGEENGIIEAKYFDSVLSAYREQVINQAIEVIRNRVDEFGVAEPVIAAQGSDRILVQLPGVSDPARAKELINKTAKLDFRLVDSSLAPDKVQALVAEAEKSLGITLQTEGMTYLTYVRKVNESLKDKLPPNTMITFEKAPNAVSMEAGKIAYLLRTDTDVSGDQLEDAFMSFGQYGEPKVSFRFGTEGRRKFGEVTGKNVGQRLAIVLDEVIYSAPNIQERIDGEGQISLGSRNHDEAQKEGSLIATALRAGALPAALQQLEERSVGPSLGADSIEKGKKAGVVGMILVVIFTIAYYRLLGVIASIGLGLNALGLLAILSALGATLTLPGIAGISLTMGMAIDANVIIYERIREELRKGMGIKAAVKGGFDHAWSAVFDSNLTTAIAGAVLIYFGSGAVRGFGVTLIAGIVTTMITAVFVSHFLIDVAVHKFNVKKLGM